MKAEEFNVGDWVVRLNDEHLGIKRGQVCQIYEFHPINKQPRLQGQYNLEGSHSLFNLRKALSGEIPGYAPFPDTYNYLTPILKKLNIK